MSTPGHNVQVCSGNSRVRYSYKVHSNKLTHPYQVDLSV